MLDQFDKILVTGGLGFIGRHLVDALLALGKGVVVLDNLSTVINERIRTNGTLVEADLRDFGQVMKAMSGAELIFHVGANSNGTVSVEHPRVDFETNTVGTFNALEGAVSVGVKKFIYLSSASVYGKPQRFPIAEEHPTQPFLPYGVSKLAGELYCLSFFNTYSLPVVVARPFCLYGPGEDPRSAMVEVSRYLRWHLNDNRIQIVGHMDNKTRDFIHISDAIQALLLIADRGGAGEVFNVGSGTEVSMRELTEIIDSVTGRKVRIEEIHDVTDDTYRLVPDISKLKALGYMPRTPLAEGVKRLAVELGENPELPSGSTIFKKGQRAEK